MIKTWNYVWPEWVPEKVRSQIEGSWDNERAWMDNAKLNGGSEIGSIVSLPKLGSEKLCVPGRFVFAWNNIGRVVHDDGSFDYVSFYSQQNSLLRHLL